MPQDDPGLDLYEILAKNGRSLLGQKPPAVSKDPGTSSRIRRTGKVDPIPTSVKRLSGPVPPYSPGNQGASGPPGGGEKNVSSPATAETAVTRWSPPGTLPAPTVPFGRRIKPGPVAVRPWRGSDERVAAPGAAKAEAAASGLGERIRRSMSEIVVDVNTAFFVFVVMVSSVYVAFVLGYRRGQEEAARVRADAATQNAMPEDGQARMRSAAPPRRDDYVLLLSVYNEDESVRGYRSAEEVERLAGEVLRDLRAQFGDTFDVAVFRDPEHLTRSLVATGGFRSEGDSGLERLVQFFRGYEGPRQEPERFPYVRNQKLRVDHPSLGSFVTP